MALGVVLCKEYRKEFLGGGGHILGWVLVFKSALALCE